MPDRDHLPALDAAALSAVVHAATGNAALHVTDWECTLLRETSAYVTAGVYRLSGIGREPLSGEAHPWSVVLKIIHIPSPAGGLSPERRDRLTTPSHPAFWRREALVYQSDLLTTLPSGFAAPHCFAVEERPGNVIWLWLEDVADQYRSLGQPWPFPDRFLLAARHLGRFNGMYLGCASLSDYAWLSRGDAREWVEHTGPPALQLMQRPGIWDYPLLRRFLPTPIVSPLLRLWDEREIFLGALEQLPQTLCHRDPLVPFNLFARRTPDGDEETVAIDWGAAGIGPVGEDLAHLIEGSSLRVLIHDAGMATHEAAVLHVREQVFQAYLAGIREVGTPTIDERMVRFGVLASGILQRTFHGVRRLLEQAVSDHPDEQEVRRAADVTHLRVYLADEARALLVDLRRHGLLA